MTVDFGIHGLGDHSNFRGYEPLGPSSDSDSTLLPFLRVFFLGKGAERVSASRGGHRLVSLEQEMGLNRTQGPGPNGKNPGAPQG